MMLQYLRQKLRLFRFDRKKKKTGGIYHHHFHEIVVTKEELSIQLHIANNHDNLLKLLIYGKSLHDYDVRLTRAALKFAFLGSLVYPEGDGKTNKPKSSVYVYRLFQESSETLDEVKDRISLITQSPVSDESARKIFRKLVVVPSWQTCLKSGGRILTAISLNTLSKTMNSAFRTVTAL